MKLKVKKDFKDLKTNIIRKKNETFEVDENRANELMQKRICRRSKNKERKSNSCERSRDSNRRKIKMQRENEKIAKFYKSQKWQKCRNSYITSKNYICERCGNCAKIVHHKIYINENNIDNFEIILDFNNLECLCLSCHNQEHFKQNKVEFDENGDLTVYS